MTAMEDLIIIAVLVCILGAAARYLYKAKKRGAGCIGCSCGGKCSCGCGGSEGKTPGERP